MLAKVSRFCTKSFCRRNVGSRRTAFLLAHLTHEFEKKRSAQTEHDEAVGSHDRRQQPHILREDNVAEA